MTHEPTPEKLKELEALRARVAALEKECGVEPPADRFRIIFENAPDAMYLHDMTGIFVDGNRAAEKLTGYNRDELVGKSFLKMNLLPKSQLPKAAFNMFSKTALGFASGPDDFSLQCKDGSTAEVEIRSYPVTLDGRRLALGIARDISGRKQAQREVIESEERYRSMVELAPDGIMTMNRSGIITSCNDAFLKLSGFSRSEIVGRHLSRLPTLIPQDLPGHTRTVAQLLKGRGTAPVAFNWKRKDGARRLGEARVARLRQNGKVTGLQAIVRDVTDSKNARELLLALNRASLVIEQAESPDTMFDAVSDEVRPLGVSCTLFDYDAGADALIMRRISVTGETMSSVERMVGSNAVGSSASVDISPLFRRLVRKRETFYGDDIAPFIKEFLPLRSDALARKICSILKVSHYMAAPLTREGAVTGALLIHGDAVNEQDTAGFSVFANQVAAVWHKHVLMDELRDRLRELGETQAQLLQSQKMEAIGVLAGGVAHDFNNLLTVIIGYSDMALSADTESPFMRPALEIRKAAEQAAALTGQLLAFSRKQPSNPRPIDLNATVNGMQKMLERMLGENSRLENSTTNDVLPIKADPGQVGQVLMNLVINANDAMESGGTISVRTRRAVIDDAHMRTNPDARSGHYAVLVVEDTGTGIAPDDLAHIFEPFFTTKPLGKGTGLGLSVAYGIIRQHQGWIDVDSEPGRGTVFTVFLPLLSGLQDDPSGEHPGALLSEEQDGAAERVLYVEDAASVSGFTVNALQERGYNVSVHASAEDGLEAFRQNPDAFSLVVSDVVLPGMSGVEMVSRIRGERPGIKVLLTSGYTGDQAQWPEVREQNIPFLHKPYGVNQLYRALDALEKAAGSSG